MLDARAFRLPLVVACCLTFDSIATAQTPGYKLEFLGAPGYYATSASAIANDGSVVGTVETWLGVSSASLWTSQGQETISPPFGVDMYSRAISDSGIVAINVHSNPGYLARLWINGEFRELDSGDAELDRER